MSLSNVQDPAPLVEHPYFHSEAAPLVAVPVGRTATTKVPMLDWRQVLSGALILVGGVMLVVGWVGTSGTKETYEQLSYFISGGLGGAAAVMVGATIWIAFEHHRDREAIAQMDDRLAEFENRVHNQLESLADSARQARTAIVNGTSAPRQKTATRR